MSVVRPGEATPTEIWTSIENIAKIKTNPKDKKNNHEVDFSYHSPKMTH